MGILLRKESQSQFFFFQSAFPTTGSYSLYLITVIRLSAFLLAVIVTFLSCAMSLCCDQLNRRKPRGLPPSLPVTVLASVGGAAINHGVIFSYSIMASRASGAVCRFVVFAAGAPKRNEK